LIKIGFVLFLPKYIHLYIKKKWRLDLEILIAAAQKKESDFFSFG
jgi:hypothetical protein